MTYLVPTAPGVYKHMPSIYIADEIVQSAEENVLYVYKVQVINCFQRLQAVMGKSRFSKRQEFLIYFSVASKITRLIIILRWNFDNCTTEDCIILYRDLHNYRPLKLVMSCQI